MSLVRSVNDGFTVDDPGIITRSRITSVTFMRTLAMPKTAEPWSLTSLKENPIALRRACSYGCHDGWAYPAFTRCATRARDDKKRSY